MVVRIRLARFGRVNQPFYNIVVSQARTARNSKPIEVIGTYDPIPKQDPYDATTKPHKDIRLDSLRARYWIGVGAQPTETVWRLLSMVRHILFLLFYDSYGMTVRWEMAMGYGSMLRGRLES
ncbi:ribosomal protein S16, mitochondrial [Colletotrichum liriopes]|uniref:Ribosomal protein S16, mitochondrial n=1 Tax=Colletotrichum liriopes TaxID=708192 RepID=A0AA37GPD5_9PEZI|nr:ribosomal protein S16, mitochondrial [Colletotrichum liriopes]